MTKLYSVDAIIIRARDYGEADKILTLYTKEHGKVQAIAKGVRKPASRLRGGVQLFSHSRILLYRGRTLDTATQAETKEAYAGLRDDFLRFAYASYFLELVDSAVLEREPNEGLFVLILISLGLLMGNDPEIIARLFEIRFLHQLGLRPFLRACLDCGRPVKNGIFYVVPALGGLICADCQGEKTGNTWISAGAAQTMNKLLSIDPRRIFQLKISPAMRKEIESALEKNLEYHLEKTTKAKVVLNSMFKKLKG